MNSSEYESEMKKPSHKESNPEIFNAFIKTAPVLFWLKDTNNNIIKISEAAARLHGKSVNEIEGRPLDPDLVESISDQIRKQDRDVIRLKKPVLNISHSMVIPDTGETIFMRLNKIPITDSKGKVTHIVIYGEDITEQKETEEALKKNLAHKRALLNAIPDQIFITDENGVFSDFKADETRLFVEPELIIGKNIRDLLPEDVAEKCLHHIKEASLTKNLQMFEYKLTVNDVPRFFEVRLNAADGNILALVRDISDRRNAENENIKSRTEFRTIRNEIIHNLSDAIVSSIPLDDFYSLVHSGLSRLLPAENLCIWLYNEKEKVFTQADCPLKINKPGAQSLKNDLLDYVIQSMHPVLFNNEEYTAVIKDNKLAQEGKIPAWWMGVPMKTGEDCLGVMTLFTESAEQKLGRNEMEIMTIISNLVAIAISKKNTEDNLAQELDFLNSLMDNFNDLIYVKDLDSRFMRISKTFADRLNLNDPAEIIGKTDFDIYNESHAREAFEDEQQIIKTGIPMIGKDELEIWPNGEKRWSNSSKMPWHNAEGKIMGTFGVSFDITQRKNAEEALLISEARLKEAQQIGKIGSFELNVLTKEFYWSDEIYRFFGADPETGPLTTDKMLDRLHPSSKALFEESLKLMLSGKADSFKDNEIRIIDEHNNQYFIQTQVNIVKNSDDNIIRYSGTFQDITERKYVEMALQESRRNLAETNKMLKLIINSIPIRVYWKSQDSVFIGCNMRFAEDAGFSKPEEVTGKTDYDMPWKEKAEAYCKDDHEVMTKDLPKISIEEKRTISQEKMLWNRISKVPLKNMENEIIGILGTYDDITNLKEKEEELNHKNEELERFTYTVSHDLKSPLVTIRGFVGLLEEDIESGDIENVRINIERIKSAADKMSHLLSNLLELSRVGRFSNPFVRISMSKILKDTLEGLTGILQPRKIKVIFPESMPEVFADAQRMMEVWQNLIENAVKFMGDQPNPVIEIGYSSGRKETEFFIRDNGIGINEKYHDTVFGLFNKLDNKSDGTGFGLALVKRIIEVHGGTISVESAGIGHGTTFRFSIPLIKNK